VYPLNAALAEELAAYAKTTTQALGLGGTTAATARSTRPRPATEHIIDTVVCAAADAMNLPPEAVRPAVRAAFRRAQQAGFTREEVEAALAEPPARATRATPKRASDAAE
jgi:hypothetical protein